MKRIALTIGALMLLAAPASACNVVRAVAVKQVAVAAVAVPVAPVAVATFVPVAVPQYSVGYGVPAVGREEATVVDEVAALKEEVKALREALKQALTPPAPMK